MASAAEVKLDNGRTVRIAQETRYPWDGAVKMTVDPDQSAALTIHVRIPGWARNEPVPGDLYRFADKSAAKVGLKVNGKAAPIQVEKRYVSLSREWKRGDVIELNLPMPVRRVLANEQVAEDRGRVALERGPIVYAVEWADNPKGQVRDLILPDTERLTAEFKPALLNGVTVVKGKALSGRSEQAFTAIPYYAWANRGRGEMIVWIRNHEPATGPDGK